MLTFKCKSYPFKVYGLSAVGAGAEKIDGAGDIYSLTSLADFLGVYGSAAGSVKSHDTEEIE